MRSGHLPGIYTVPSSDYQKSGYKVVIFEESTQYSLRVQKSKVQLNIRTELYKLN